MNPTPIRLDYVCQVLEIDRREVRSLADLQRLARRQRKVLARKHHPDMGGDVRKMAEVNRVADHVAKCVRIFTAQDQEAAARQAQWDQARARSEWQRAYAQQQAYANWVNHTAGTTNTTWNFSAFF